MDFSEGATFSNCESACALNIEKMMEAISMIPECPLNKLAKSKGFDLDKGDKMILPIEFSDHVPDRIGVFFSHAADSIILIRGDIFKYY